MGQALVIDIGNTRLKWGVCDAEHSGLPTWIERGAFETYAASTPNVADLIAVALRLASNVEVRLCSVIGDAGTHVFIAALESRGLKVHRMRSVAALAGVENGYADPTQLGVDRFVAHIAAHRDKRCNQLVVLAGTALTVDFVDASGRFHGGTISPGLYTMLQSLRKGTAQLPLVTTPVAWPADGVPMSTDDAIAAGIAAALVGPVLAMRSSTQLVASEPDRILVAGGNGSALVALLKSHAGFASLAIELRETLVLDGVFCAINN
jgi:type III pantothenate kinase